LAVFNTYVEYDYPLVPQEEWNKYKAAADALNAKIKALNQEIGKVEAPYKKALFENMLAKLPPDIQEAFKTPEDKRTPGQKLLVAQVSRVSGNDDDEPGAKIKLNDQDTKTRQDLEDQIDFGTGLVVVIAAH